LHPKFHKFPRGNTQWEGVTSPAPNQPPTYLQCCDPVPINIFLPQLFTQPREDLARNMHVHETYVQQTIWTTHDPMRQFLYDYYDCCDCYHPNLEQKWHEIE